MRNKKLLKFVLIFIIYIIYVQKGYAQDKKKLDSLKYLLKTAKHDTAKLQLKHEIGDISNINRASYYDSLSIDCERLLISSSNQNVSKTIKKYLAENLLIIGHNYFDDNNDNVPKAFEYLNKSLKISEEIGFHEGIINSLLIIGHIYEEQEDTLKAFEYYNKSLKISEKSGDRKGIEVASNIIGILYFKQSNINALEYFNKCLKVNKELENKVGIAYCYKNIGSVYFKMAKQDSSKLNFLNINITINKALEYNNKSLKVYEELSDNVGIAKNYLNLGSIYLFQSQVLRFKQDCFKKDSLIKKSLEIYFKSLNLYKKYGDKPDIVNVLLKIGGLYSYINDMAVALNYATKAFKLSIESGNLDRIQRSSEFLKIIYLKIGNFKKAYKYYNLEIKILDSVAKNKKIIFTQKQQAKYEYGKKAAIDSIANSKEIEFKNNIIGKQKIIILYFVIGFVVFIALLIIIFRLFLQKGKANIKLANLYEETINQNYEIESQRNTLDKQNQLLAKQKKQLEQKQAIIEQEMNQLLNKNMEAENQQLKQQIHPHFLFNSLYTLKILIENNNEIAIDYIIYLSNFLRVSISSEKTNLVTIKEELKFCIDYLSMQKIRYEEALKYNITISEDIQNTGLIPIFSIQQLLENAIKHNTFSINKPLDLRIIQEDDRIKIINNIQKKYSQETSTGIGLKNISERYRILSGDEVIINNDNNEFSVSIKIL